MEDLISVIVPVYNVQEYLKKCIDSIIKQTYKNIEIILVDDGSTDNSGKICDEYKKIDKRIKVIHKENKGLSDARNVGIDIATGKYVTFIDSDDFVSDIYIEYMYSIMKKTNSDIGICKIKVIYDRNIKEQRKIDIEPKIYNKIQAFENLLYSEGIDVAANAKIYPKYYFDDIKYPINEKYEDVAIIYKIFEKTTQIAYGNLECYYYYVRIGSISKSGFNKGELDYLKNTEQMLTYLENNYKELKQAVTRFRLYSRFRILRILLFSETKDEKLKETMIKDIKKYYKKILKDKRAPKRDKLAIYFFNMGLPIFKFVWYLYSKITHRVL